MTTTRPLFGGALVMEVPTAWRDVSDTRPVPDHQECFVDPEFAKFLLVIEILQREDNVSDTHAASHFFYDLAQANGSETTTFDEGAAFSVPSLSDDGAVVVVSGKGSQRISMGRDRDIFGNSLTHAQVRDVSVWVCALRLGRHATDVLITLTLHGTEEAQVAQASTLFQSLLDTFQIRDWCLFG